MMKQKIIHVDSMRKQLKTNLLSGGDLRCLFFRQDHLRLLKLHVRLRSGRIALRNRVRIFRLLLLRTRGRLFLFCLQTKPLTNKRTSKQTKSTAYFLGFFVDFLLLGLGASSEERVGLLPLLRQRLLVALLLNAELEEEQKAGEGEGERGNGHRYVLQIHGAACEMGHVGNSTRIESRWIWFGVVSMKMGYLRGWDDTKTI